MSHDHTNLVEGGWWQSAAGAVVSAWSWMVGDANGLTIILTLLTIALTLVKLVEAVRRWRWANEFIGANRPILQKIRDAVTTPAELKD